MKKRGDTANEDEAKSIQVGFVLNTGILTAFIAIVLVIISGGFGEDLSTRDELELVADSVEAKMVEADRLAQTSDEYTAFFEPPTSNLQYRGVVDSSGTLTLTPVRGATEVTRDLDSITLRDVSGNDIKFSQTTQNIIVEYDEDGSGEIELSVQKNATRSR